MLWSIVLLVLALPMPAHAYVDPGTGSLVIQALIASAVGFGLTMRRQIAHLARRMRPRKESDTPPAAGAERDDAQ